MSQDLPWLEAIEKVLSESDGAMHYKDIANKIIEDGLRTSVGATPTDSVTVNLSTSMRNPDSPFVRVRRGEYWLRSKTESKSQPDESTTTTPDPSSQFSDDDDTEEQYEIISSFGMYWRRDLVHWTTNPSILGIQQIGAEPVDFQKQLGIYLLYDGREVIYVGRSDKNSIGKRLSDHTKDRLATRWDRFSWFGILPVTDDGDLQPIPETFSSDTLIPALEAILIEALEPRQNRRRGDDLSAVEYLQKEDPEIERRKKQAVLQAALNNI